ncbi:anti-sigma factor [Mycolicibacterium neworleansense]|uniref:Putative alanine rich protein n=1 Tax=Mycolicibacterium neworleansense TaxID=146018 RepID=A0A0H5RSS5_9MYCO|nr:hypothetical protein [Mycolicibacterium neworleansense]MCV7360162.1 hypothetical protein [Mycolicibacterium neworleansense]CRZ17235.1 putative alanine rich protein [Mycolicibacterium neworleansense]
MNGSTPRVPSDGPIPDELLADLQAGLLDDATAAEVRRRVRTDPVAGPEARKALAALDRVRRDLRELATDPQSAPPVPAEVSARLSEALRAEPKPPTPSAKRRQSIAAVAGVGAAAVAAVVGAAVLMRAPVGQAPSTMASLGQITVSPPRGEVGLSESQILGLLSAPPDLGPLGDTWRRSACLTGLGYPAGVQVLGARPLEVAGRPGVLVLVPPKTPGTPDSVVAVVLPADCDAGHAGSLAQTVVKRPVKRP